MGLPPDPQRNRPEQYVANLETQPQKEILAVTLSSIGDAVIITDIKGRITFLMRLFRRFEQCDIAPGRKDRGLGLGLSIAKALVEAHGGTLSADSKGPGHGSSFFISFPTFKETAGGFAADGSAQPSAKDRGNLRVLLLEDHEDTARVMGKVLVQMGHEVETSATVAAASEKLRERKFDVILSDIGLPDGTGIDFIRAREICQTPAVALTGYRMAEDVEECLQAGFDEHLTKPVDIERLQKTLSKVSEKRPRPGA